VGKAEKREVTFPLYDIIQGRFKISASELFIFSKAEKKAKAQFTPIEISSHWGNIFRLGEHILMLKNLRK